MTELVIALLKLLVRNPHRQTLTVIPHPPINRPSRLLRHPIRHSPQRPHPQLPPKLITHAIHRVFQAPITMCIGLDVPELEELGRGACAEATTPRAEGVVGASREGALALYAVLPEVGAQVFAMGARVRAVPVSVGGRGHGRCDLFLLFDYFSGSFGEIDLGELFREWVGALDARC
jgi:hypothetical protein